jgi:hypothetical protein
MPGFISNSPLARDLIRIGDNAIVHEDDAALRAYFAADYVFHGPGGDLSFDRLRAYFASLRAAFSHLRIVREQIIVDGNFLAARNTFSGDFTRVLLPHWSPRAHGPARRVGSDQRSGLSGSHSALCLGAFGLCKARGPLAGRR